MKAKFWFSYLALVLLLSAIAYVAISEETDVPLTLSDEDMAVLRGTGADEKCILSSSPGCTTNTSCSSPTYRKTYGYNFNDCQDYTDSTCSWRGPHDAQTLCVTVPYDSGCNNYGQPVANTSSDCVSH